MKLAQNLSLLALLLLLAITTNAQNTSRSGLDEKYSANESRIEKIDQMLDEAIQMNQIPGVVAMIVQNGEVVYYEAKGFANVSSGQEMAKNQIFRIASQSKAITSTGVMILWEEGKFQLDDPISKWIPEFKSPSVLDTFNEADSSYTTKPASREVTIRDLITHTSGVGYGVIDGDPRIKKIYAKAEIVDLFTTEYISIEENIRKLAKLPLKHNPGERFSYSEGLDVLGYFIEIMSGMPFDQFLQTRIFDPLGMVNTGFYLNEEQSARLVTVQQKVEGVWQPYPVTFYDTDYPKTGAKKFFSGGAGLSSTAEDYAKFLQMYLNGGEYNGARILSSTTIKTIMNNQVGDLLGNGGKDYGLAFGLVDEVGVAKGGIGSYGTFDWGGYFNTQYFADPETQTVGILMKQTQGGTGDQTGWKFRQMVFATLE